MDAATKTLLASHVARIEALDAELIEEPTRRSLLAWLGKLPPEDSPAALELLTTAFDADDADTSTMLSLIDKRLRRHVPRVGKTCTFFLEILVTNAALDHQVPPILESLESANEEDRRRILAKLPIPNRGLKNAHSAFRAAWDASPRDAHYRERVHQGEHAPVLKTVTLLELVLFIAARVAPFVPEEHATAFETAFAFAKTALTTPPEKDGARPPFRTWNAADSTQVMIQACRMSAEHYRFAPGSPDRTWIAPYAAKAAAGLIAGSDTSKNAPEVQRFLRDLDEELRRLDIVTAVGKKRIASPITQAIYRSRDIWLARLANGGYGLLLKNGRRSTWLDGDRDEVLGSIPDDHFERAVLAAKEPD